jgi:hypothetical protein
MNEKTTVDQKRQMPPSTRQMTDVIYILGSAGDECRCDLLAALILLWTPQTANPTAHQQPHHTQNTSNTFKTMMVFEFAVSTDTFMR